MMVCKVTTVSREIKVLLAIKALLDQRGYKDLKVPEVQLVRMVILEIKALKEMVAVKVLKDHLEILVLQVQLETKEMMVALDCKDLQGTLEL